MFSEATSLVSKSKDIFDEIFIILARLGVGSISLVLVFALLSLDESRPFEFINSLLSFQASAVFYYFFIVSAYIYGTISIITFDVVFGFLVEILQFVLSKIANNKLKPFLIFVLNQFTSIKTLHSSNKELDSAYREKAKVKLAQYFDLNNTSIDEIFRFSRQLCDQKGLIKSSARKEHFYDLLKAIAVNILILTFIVLIKQHQAILSLLLFLFFWIVIRAMKSNTERDHKSIIDCAYLYIIQTEKEIKK